MDKIKDKFQGLPQKMCKTITFDQGTEFSAHRYLEHAMKCKVYYCETHSPWQKGSNENMNGRLRWYLPRETDIAALTQETLDQLAAKMNHCPRKCLGFKTPNELFVQQYGEIRRNVLVKTLPANNLEEWENRIKMLAALKAMYDEASQNIALLDLNL